MNERAFRQVRAAGWLPFFVVFVVGLVLFGAVLFAVLTGSATQFDRAILLSLRIPGDLSTPIGSHFMQETMRDCTALGGTAFRYVLITAVSGFLLLKGRMREAVTLWVVNLGGQILATGLKHLVDRPRPDLVPHGSFVSSASFPSGHAMGSAVLFLTLAVLIARRQTRTAIKVYVLALAVFATIMVGISRVYLGVHWPTDVLAGWSLGAAWVVLCWGVLEWLDRPSDTARLR